MTDPQVERKTPETSRVMAILHEISILGGLTEEQLAEVLKLFGSVNYRAGDRIFEQGESPSNIYVIVSGHVKIVVGIDTEPMELVEYGCGQCFGETSALGIQPHSATAVAVDDAELLVLSNRALHHLFNSDPKTFGLLILNIAREACRRLHKTDQILLHYAAAKAGVHGRQNSDTIVS